MKGGRRRRKKKISPELEKNCHKVAELTLIVVHVRVLGSAQDGGIPHPNCSCANCSRTTTRYITSIAVEGKENCVLIDATPDFTQQTAILKRAFPDKQMGCDAIFLTHLHIGHYIGLVMLGKEAASTERMDLFATSKNHQFLQNNKPFSYLYQRDEITKRIVQPGKNIDFHDFSIEALEVPHRNEDGDTVGYLICGKDNNLLYLPDIDHLTDKIIELLQSTDIVLFDGSFYDQNELPRQKEVPHPTIISTIERVGARTLGSFYFTHFNHTNPVLRENTILQRIHEMGYDIVFDGMRIEI